MNYIGLLNLHHGARRRFNVFTREKANKDPYNSQALAFEQFAGCNNLKEKDTMIVNISSCSLLDSIGAINKLHNCRYQL